MATKDNPLRHTRSYNAGVGTPGPILEVGVSVPLSTNQYEEKRSSYGKI